jgi:hypothetical protein
MQRLFLVFMAFAILLWGACDEGSTQTADHHASESSQSESMALSDHADESHDHADNCGGAMAAVPHSEAHQDPKPHDGCKCKPAVKRTLYHEMGHVKWNRLDAHQKAVWTEIWELSKDLGFQPDEPYVDANGNTANYYEVNAMEGFCVAYSFIKTSETVDTTITNFFDNI